MVAYILKKKKIELKPAFIKEQLFVFVNSTIENPTFDSQTKDYLNTPPLNSDQSAKLGIKSLINWRKWELWRRHVP